MKQLLNDFDVREHHMHTDEENEENERKVSVILEAVSDSGFKYCGKYVNENGKAMFCPFESREILPEIVNLFCPKVGINIWLDGGALIVESVNNRSAETYTFTPYEQNRTARVH